MTKKNTQKMIKKWRMKKTRKLSLIQKHSVNTQLSKMKRDKKMGGEAKKTTLNCAPKGNDFDENNFSCYANSTLQKLKTLWNNKSQIKISSNNPKDIWSQIKENFKGICDKESCWISKLDGGEIGKKIIDSSFSPVRPKSWDKNKEEWLSDYDIEEVLNQYETAYKCFYFFKPSPIDFCETDVGGSRKVSSEICDINLKDLISKGKTKLGFVFNLDKHTGPGTHWVSLFVNVKKKWIFFFDSVGETAPKTVKSLVENIMKQGIELGIKFKYDENHPKEHQYGNSACGLYSLYFILTMLKDTYSINYFKKGKITDAQMQKYRKIYFNSSL